MRAYGTLGAKFSGDKSTFGYVSNVLPNLRWPGCCDIIINGVYLERGCYKFGRMDLTHDDEGRKFTLCPTLESSGDVTFAFDPDDTRRMLCGEKNAYALGFKIGSSQYPRYSFTRDVLQLWPADASGAKGINPLAIQSVKVNFETPGKCIFRVDQRCVNVNCKAKLKKTNKNDWLVFETDSVDKNQPFFVKNLPKCCANPSIMFSSVSISFIKY